MEISLASNQILNFVWISSVVCWLSASKRSTKHGVVLKGCNGFDYRPIRINTKKSI